MEKLTTRVVQTNKEASKAGEEAPRYSFGNYPLVNFPNSDGKCCLESSFVGHIP